MKTLIDAISANLNALMQYRLEHGGDLNSARAIGKRAGVGKSTVSRLLNPPNDERERAAMPLPAVDTLDAIAKALNARAWQLLIDSGFDPADLPVVLTSEMRARIMTPALETEMAELRTLRSLVAKAAADESQHEDVTRARNDALGARADKRTQPTHANAGLDGGAKAHRAKARRQIAQKK